MSDNTASATKENANIAGDLKGKGKGVAEPETKDVSMDTEESSSEEEVDETAPVADEDDDDNMEEIDLGNIIGGRRTRGRKIDFAKAAEELPEEDDDDEDDDDFDGGVEDEDKMEE